MEKAEVKEYLAREAEIADALIKGRNPSELLPRDLFPEYNLSEVNGPYSTSLEPYVKVWELMPFREKLIVHVVARQDSPATFKNWYGVSVEELCDLREAGRVLIQVTLPSNYDREIASFLDPLIETKPPTSLRISRYLKHHTSQFEEYAEHIAEEFRKRSTMVVDTGTDLNRERVYHTTKSLVLQLLSLGEEDTLKAITMDKNILSSETLRRQLEALRLMKAGPHFYSLDGLHGVAWSSLTPNEYYPRGVVNRIEFVDPAVAGTLVRALKLYRPKTEVESMSVFDDYISARKALQDATSWFRSKMLDHESDAPFVLAEVQDKFEEIITNYERKSSFIDVLFWAGDFALALTPLGSVPAIVIAAARGIPELIAKITKKPDPLKTRLSALLTSPSLMSVFGVHEESLINIKKRPKH